MNQDDTIEKVDKLVKMLETMRIGDYIQLLQNRKKMMVINFLSGLARGVGTAVGFTILGAIVIYVLQRLVDLNLPLIGYYISQLIRIIQQHLD